MSIYDIDSHKLMYHPDRVHWWKKHGLSMPLHVEIGVTNRCNHRCNFCTLDWVNHGTVDIDTQKMLYAIEDMSKVGVKSIYFAGEGEPTLHKDIGLFLAKADGLGIQTSMSTNGSRYCGETMQNANKYLSWVRFSIDAGTRKTYSKIHGVSEGEFDRVLDNIKQAVLHKQNNKINIGVQAIVMPENVHEMEALCEIARDIGVNNFQVKPCHSHPKSSCHPEIFQFSSDELFNRLEKYSTDKFKVVVRAKSMERLSQERTYKQCHGFMFYSLIDARGDVVPCNVFYGNKDYIIGNINNCSFEELMRSSRRVEILKKVEATNFSMCGNYRCRLDVINRYLERVKNPEPTDVFI